LETEPPSILLDITQTTSQLASTDILLLVVLVILLLLSALISGSEVAFFSITPADRELMDDSHPRQRKILELLQEPDHLLATILISNNFVNIGIVILSTFLLNSFFDTNSWGPLMTFLVEILAITGILLLFGEILPKVYANASKLKFAQIVTPLLSGIHTVLHPVSTRLSKTINRINIEGKGPQLSVDDLGQALELTVDENSNEEEQRILKGIVRFGSTTVKEVMTPRTSVNAIDVKSPYSETLQRITESGYSRIPVYEENLDQIKGLLYVKDLLPYIDASENFRWQDLMRTPFFVPENKKIDDLLKEFQLRRVHLAIVVDEFGGTSGVISLEDVLEEIVGEISDEFDDEDVVYSKVDDHNYVFEAQTPLIDFCRVLGISRDLFDTVDGESDTLAGLVLELAGKFLERGESISFDAYTFKVESVDQRKLIRIKVSVDPNYEA